MFSLAVALAGLSLGGAAWTLTEYGAHRFTMHSTGGRGPAAHEHLMHHAQPARTRPLIRIIGHVSMYATAAVIGWILALFVPLILAMALAVGWALGYTAYEGAHFHAHHHPPLGSYLSSVGRYDLWLRKRHFHHHFVAPKTNLGVLVPWWDQLFGTEAPVGTIKVPRRVAMSWLIDDSGNVHDVFTTDYTVVGRRRDDKSQRANDIEAAFADQPLALD